MIQLQPIFTARLNPTTVAGFKYVARAYLDHRSDSAFNSCFPRIVAISTVQWCFSSKISASFAVGICWEIAIHVVFLHLHLSAQISGVISGTDRNKEIISYRLLFFSELALSLIPELATPSHEVPL